MFATAESRQRLFRNPLSAPALIRLLLEPTVVLGTLFGVVFIYDEPFGSPYVILSLILFSLTFPGTSRLEGESGRMLRDVALGWMLLLGFLGFFGYATGYLHIFPREVIIAWALVTPAALIIAHQLVRALLPRVLAIDRNQRRAVVAGANDLGLRLARHIQGSTSLGIRLMGYFDDRDRGRLSDLAASSLHGTLSELPAFVGKHRVDIIYVALPMASQPRILALLEGLNDTTASVYFVPDIFMTDLIQARVDNVGGIPVVAVCETPFYGINGIVKRVSDIVLSVLILILIAPLMALIALGVKAGSPGPVLFCQRRYGLDGREIIVYKFRSMTVCEDGDTIVQATRDDPRITRLGRILRSSSLDELPQFVNVLQGRMSIVGPRPHAVAHNEMYRSLIRSYMVRHKVKPGITGWAQVNGLRGETESVAKMRARIEHDLEYLRNWSLGLDLRIVLRTMVLVLKGRDAY